MSTEEAQTTLEEGRERAREAREEAIRTIERLKEEGSRLTPEAVAGEEEAYERLLEIERLVDEARSRQELADTALKELDRREDEERERAQEERMSELEGRFDELARERKKQLGATEKALGTLVGKAKALLELDREQRVVGEEMGRYPHMAPYDHVLRDRILAMLGDVLVGVPGAGAGGHTPLTEDEFFTRTIAEDERAKEIQEKTRRLQEEEEPETIEEQSSIYEPNLAVSGPGQHPYGR